MRLKLSLYFSLLLLCSFFRTTAQTVITATGYAGYYYAAASATQIYPGGGITFNVVNTNAFPIAVTDVGYSAYLTYAAELYYSSTSLTGGTGIINATNPAWTLAASVAAPASTFATIVNSFFTGFSVVIPPATTFRFAVKQDGALFGGPTLIPGTFTTSGVTLDAGGSLWGADQYGGLVNSGYGYYGSITFTDCLPPTGLTATNILSKTATVGWNASLGSAGYDYRVDVNPTYTGGTYTSLTATTDNVTGLTPNTTYYLHVRNKCGATNLSGWTHLMFKTLPPCSIPANLQTPGLQANSTGLSWDPVVVALSYDYIVNQDPADPVGSTGLKNVTIASDNINGLTEDTKYYVHIRSNCTGEQSGWSLDSFITPIPCRSPEIHIDHLNVDEAVAFWDPVKTAVGYEYAITTSATPPLEGTKYKYTSIHTSALNSGKEYFMHVRSECISQGVSSISPWATASFKTFALGVGNVAGDDFSLEAYPNPVKNMLNINIKGNASANAEMQVTDMSGRIIRDLPVDNKKQQVDISSMASGIYMLRYKDDTHNHVIRIVKE